MTTLADLKPGTSATADLLALLQRVAAQWPHGDRGHGPMVVQGQQHAELCRLLPLAIEEHAARAAETRPEERFGSWAYNAASLCSASFYGAGNGPGVDVTIHDPFQPFGAQGKAVNAVEIPDEVPPDDQEVVAL